MVDNDFNNIENDSQKSRNEKRFRLDTGCIIDHQEHEVLSERKAVNRLNTLHEENQQLRKENKALKDANDGLVGTIAHFELEDLE